MSTFENYSGTSAHYDLTRRPAGLNLILEALAGGSRPLADQVVADAGCGTGNYVAALADKVSRVRGVELNQGMLEVAKAKLSNCPGVDLQQGSILELPLEDSSCHGVVINYVLQHLEDGSDATFSETRRAVAECQRVLAPGGTMVIQTCSAVQYRQGYWYSILIPNAVDRALEHYIPVDMLEESMREVGLQTDQRLPILDEVNQGDSYLDPHGPTRAEWRDGDSSWALVSEDVLARVNREIERMLADGSMDGFLEEREARRREHGQGSIVVGRKPLNG